MGKPSTRPKSSPKNRSRSAPKAKQIAAIAATLANMEHVKPKTQKGAQVLALLTSWLADESGYDERTWPNLKRSLEKHRKRIGARKLFDE